MRKQNSSLRYCRLASGGAIYGDGAALPDGYGLRSHCPSYMPGGRGMFPLQIRRFYLHKAGGFRADTASQKERYSPCSGEIGLNPESAATSFFLITSRLFIPIAS